MGADAGYGTGAAGDGLVVSGAGAVVVGGAGVVGTVVVCTGGTVVVLAGGTVTVSDGATVIVSAGVVVVVVSVGVAGVGELCWPPKSVVSRPPPDVALPATSSGTVMITTQTRNPSSPVTIAICHERARPDPDRPRTSPCCATRSATGSSGSSGRAALRTTPRTGTACVTTRAGRASASFMSATSTGMTAADASVPRAHICEQTKAAAADAIAVIESVSMSMLDVDEGRDVDILLRLPIRRPAYTRPTIP